MAWHEGHGQRILLLRRAISMVGHAVQRRGLDAYALVSLVGMEAVQQLRRPPQGRLELFSEAAEVDAMRRACTSCGAMRSMRQRRIGITID